MKAKMYTKNGCGQCNQAKMLLAMKAVQTEEINMEQVNGAREELLTECKKLGVTPRTVPQIWLDDTYVGGFDQLKEYFDTH